MRISDWSSDVCPSDLTHKSTLDPLEMSHDVHASRPQSSNPAYRRRGADRGPRPRPIGLCRRPRYSLRPAIGGSRAAGGRAIAFSRQMGTRSRSDARYLLSGTEAGHLRVRGWLIGTVADRDRDPRA